MPKATGERLVPEQYCSSSEGYVIYLMHMAAYRFAEAFTSGKRVLDYGCGTGYGAALIANTALRVEAVDIDESVIARAWRKFRCENLAFACVPPGHTLPYADDTFDVVLSFQVLEHLPDVDGYLSEIRRALTPGGTLLLVTPDRKARLLPGQKPWNRWHIREFSAETLRDVLSRFFTDVEIQQMSGRRDFIEMELSRYRKLKWLTLPATLPAIPYRLRFWLLSALRAMRSGTREEGMLASGDFDETSVVIGPGVEPSVNLVAIGRA
jgi:SAM-dependent methyltransferase